MYKITLDDECSKVLNLILARNITNISDLRRKVLGGNLECAIIKPTLICDPFIISLAANKAAIAEKRGALKTKSLHSELLFNLSPTKNITQSLQTFGIDDKTEDCLFAIIEDAGICGVKKADEILLEIKGTVLDVTELNKISDIELLKKTYKISEKELKVSSLADSIASRIATKELD